MCWRECSILDLILDIANFDLGGMKPGAFIFVGSGAEHIEARGIHIEALSLVFFALILVRFIPDQGTNKPAEPEPNESALGSLSGTFMVAYKGAKTQASSRSYGRTEQRGVLEFDKLIDVADWQVISS